MSCTHTEGRLPDGRRSNDRHDCDYVDRRSALIPRAEAVADQVAGKEPGSAGKGAVDARARWASAWNRAFHAEMDRLSAEVEAKRDELATEARGEVVAAMRRWRRKGLTIGEATSVLRAVREAI